jgi:two-component system cell cycle sensor histidine kinase/response regulator CckA
MSLASAHASGVRLALVAPESLLDLWRVEIESMGLTAVTRFATRCDMLLGQPELEWVCVHPTMSDTGLLDLIAEGIRTIVSEELSQLKWLKTDFETNVTNRLSLAVEQIDEAIEILDASGKITYVNRAFENLTGFKAEAVLGREPEKIFENEFENGETYRLASQAVQAGESFHGVLVVRRANGALAHQEATFSPLQVGAGELGSVTIRRDISRQVRSEVALRESEKRYRVLAENATDIIWTAGMDGLIDYCSPAVKRVLGISVEQALDLTLDDFLPLNALTNIEQTELISAGSIEMLTEPITVQVEQTKHDGNQIWLEAQVSLLLGPQDEPLGVLGVSRDISQRRRVETERASLEAQLLQAQKMEAIGRLAGGIAHDFNNLLTGISVSAQLLLEAKNIAEEVALDVQDILTATDRATRLTRQLMAFSRNQVVAPQLVDVNFVVSSFERMLSRLIGEDIRMSFLPDAKSRWIEIDPIQLEQIIVNLVVNARDAMPDGGDLTIASEKAEVSSDSLGGWEAEPGEFVCLAVRDTGQGMPEEIRERIFEPFFTTKDAGKGTGLGLSTVYGIVKQNGGVIQLESTLGEGTCFKVFLPAKSAPVKPSPEKSPGEFESGSGRVLVVEDEEIVRSLARRLLEKQGYEVVEAIDGNEAWELCETQNLSFDLVLTDVVMPGMSGPRLIEKLRESRSAMKVIYMSGYVDEELEQDALGQPNTRFIQKPFSVGRLLDLIQNLLGT